jgi:hypothetical protein
VLCAIAGVATMARARERPHTGTVVIVADPSKPLTLKPADLLSMTRTSITVKQPDGRGVTNEHRTNGQPLLPVQGPIRIVAPKDLASARSMRMLERIEVVRLTGK